MQGNEGLRQRKAFVHRVSRTSYDWNCCGPPPSFSKNGEAKRLVTMGGTQCRQPLRGAREQLAQEQGHDHVQHATWINGFGFLS